MDTFSDFKKGFYSRIDDFTVFDCQDFNLLKVVLDGLKVDYASKGKMPDYLFSKFFTLYSFLRTVKLRVSSSDDTVKKLKSLNQRDVMLLDSGRITVNEKGEHLSAYFDNLLSCFDSSKLIFGCDKVSNSKVNYDVNFSELQFQFSNGFKNDFSLVKSIRNTFQNIEELNKFTVEELNNIKYAFHKFYFDYIFWDFCLSRLRLKKIYFLCHYHKEGFELAAKRRKIELIELQHGLISRKDIFYVFPKRIEKIREKALFPDKILVYGDYWKSILLSGTEFRPNQIEVLGDYRAYNSELGKEQLNKLLYFKGNSRLAVVTTQPGLRNEFLKIIPKFQKEAKRFNIKIVIKPHPSEDINQYRSVENESVMVINEDLMALFKYCSWNFTIYSTTCFDAQKLSIPSFLFYVESCDDYIKDLVDAEVAKVFNFDFSVLDENPDLKGAESYYARPKFHILHPN